MNKKSFVFCVLMSSTIYSVMNKNYKQDLFNQRVVAVYGGYKNQVQKKNTIKEEEPLQTRVCSFNKTGTILFNLKSGNAGYFLMYNGYNGAPMYNMWSSTLYTDCIPCPRESDWALVGNNEERGWEEFEWCIKGRFPPNIYSRRSVNNAIKASVFSSTGDGVLCTREKDTFFYNRWTNKEYTWTFLSGNKKTTFLNENYMISIPRINYLVSVFPIRENPKEQVLDQGEIFAAEQVVLSHDEKTFAVASTYADEERSLTQIILYDAGSLKEIRKLYIPGALYSGKRTEQHESIYFSLDDKRLFMHTLTKKEGMSSWYVDVNSNGNFVRIKHSPYIQKLYELAGEYNFGGIEPKKVVIFDVRKPNQSVDFTIQGATHVALHPKKDSKYRAIIADKSTRLLIVTN